MNLARAFATHNALALFYHLQLHRTLFVQVPPATSRPTVFGSYSAPRFHHQGEVETVHEAHVEVIQPASAIQSELCQSDWCGGAATFYSGGDAITSDARETSGDVVGAEGPAPESAGPGWRHLDGVGVPWLENEARGVDRPASGSR